MKKNWFLFLIMILFVLSGCSSDSEKTLASGTMFTGKEDMQISDSGKSDENSITDEKDSLSSLFEEESEEDIQNYSDMNHEHVDTAFSSCGGAGKIQCITCKGEGFTMIGNSKRACPICKGNGFTGCYRCSGSGIDPYIGNTSQNSSTVNPGAEVSEETAYQNEEASHVHSDTDCTECGGTGHVVCITCKGTGSMSLGGTKTRCAICKGTGYTKCAACNGSGIDASVSSPYTLEEIMDEINYEPADCPICGGTGKGDCPYCENGYRIDDYRRGTKTRCSICNGTGQYCKWCRGTGKVLSGYKDP